MTEKDFAIVCDAGCDLPARYLERAQATLVGPAAPIDPDVESPGADEALTRDFVEAYRSLAEGGHRSIVSVHSTAAFSGELACARAAAEACSDVADVRVVDSGSASAATGMIVFRLACHRADGAGPDEAVAAARELASHVRLLVIPTVSAGFSRRRRHQARRGILGRATTSLRVRFSGERSLYLISRGEVTQLARSADLADLTGRLAHAMSAVSSGEGPLVYATVATDDLRARRMLEKPLDTNEFEARCLGAVRATPPVEAALGAGAVGVAFAPEDAYWRAAVATGPQDA